MPACILPSAQHRQLLKTCHTDTAGAISMITSVRGILSHLPGGEVQQEDPLLLVVVKLLTMAQLARHHQWGRGIPWTTRSPNSSADSTGEEQHTARAAMAGARPHCGTSPSIGMPQAALQLWTGTVAYGRPSRSTRRARRRDRVTQTLHKQCARGDAQHLRNGTTASFEQTGRDAARSRAPLDARNAEVASMLASLAEGARAGERREAELREAAPAAEGRAAAAEGERSRLVEAMAAHKATAAAQAAELSSLREVLKRCRGDGTEACAALAEAQRAANNASKGLAVERELSARAELREESERRECTAGESECKSECMSEWIATRVRSCARQRKRTAVTGQLMAIEVIEALGVRTDAGYSIQINSWAWKSHRRWRLSVAARKRVEAERIAAEAAAAAEQAQRALSTSLCVAEERSTELEAEARTLREAMQSATSSVTQEHLQGLMRAQQQQQQEDLQELTRSQGRARVRLAALEVGSLSERQRLEAAVAELDAKVRDGEVQRRKLHNLVQEVS
ncbi:hypothetical protein JKP88DRAFT_247489 [Tribonema minus]|uniref:Uncharacterized protein n=1 Tax=Tribonema minus TaxID=303371 RepID=A0A835YZ78_9STRA|nr:hypothetical protein JKP88DRAFT_247489 [Tribonema minus]